MSSTVTAYPIPWGRGVLLLEPIPASSLGNGRVLPGQVASSSQGPHWWAMWGSVSRSRTLRHAVQPNLEPGFEPALVDLLYPLSYSRLRKGTCLKRIKMQSEVIQIKACKCVDLERRSQGVAICKMELKLVYMMTMLTAAFIFWW